MGNLANQAQSAELTPLSTMNDLHALIRAKRGQIESVMSDALGPERLYSMLQSAVAHEPKLLECTPESIIACCMKCSVLGLEPSNVDGLGKAYILPYGNKNYANGRREATFILGYKGMIELARRSGELSSINVTPVFEDDGIDLMMDEAGQPYLTRGKVNLDADHSAGKLRFVFLNAELANGSHYRTYIVFSQVGVSVFVRYFFRFWAWVCRPGVFYWFWGLPNMSAWLMRWLCPVNSMSRPW